MQLLHAAAAGAEVADAQPGRHRDLDKVYAAIAKCVVLVVSGRPQVFDTSKVDALVASWLPGSEGDGVADVLFGKKPFTGRLSQTWPASADQEPINVGDPNYAPAFPYGWGLRTDSPWARLHAARASLGTGDPALRAARADIAQALNGRFWSGDRIKDKASVVAALARAVGDLTRRRARHAEGSGAEGARRGKGPAPPSPGPPAWTTGARRRRSAR